MMTCNNCQKPCDAMRSVIYRRQIIEGCDKCLHTRINANANAAKYERDWQNKEYRREITQPNQGRDFIRAYGVETARKYMNDETIRKLA